MKWYAHKKRTESQFEVGASVLLKLQPYKQSSIKRSLPSKLIAKYYGPNKIIEKVGKVAYKLQLPREAKIKQHFPCFPIK